MGGNGLHSSGSMTFGFCDCLACVSGIQAALGSMAIAVEFHGCQAGQLFDLTAVVLIGCWVCGSHGAVAMCLTVLSSINWFL